MQSHRRLITRVYPHTGGRVLGVGCDVCGRASFSISCKACRLQQTLSFLSECHFGSFAGLSADGFLEQFVYAPAAGEKPVHLPGSSGNPRRFLLVFGSPHFCRGCPAWECELTRSSLSFRDVFDFPLRFGRFPATIFPRPLPLCCPWHPCHVLGSNGDHS